MADPDAIPIGHDVLADLTFLGQGKRWLAARVMASRAIVCLLTVR